LIYNFLKALADITTEDYFRKLEAKSGGNDIDDGIVY
jgi:hypothetical protein